MSKGIQMGYLKDFRTLISSRDYPAFLRLWEEYCESDELDTEEVITLLKEVKKSEFADPFGRYIEKIFPLWELSPDSPEKHEIFKLIIDLETTNHESLRQKIFEYLRSRYGTHKLFNEKIKLIGLRNKDSFQGAVANFELLNHMEKGNFVFHAGGWGVGEIMDVSFLREQLSLEFDYVSGRKDISFENAFKTLIPIPKDHFLAMRFGAADLLEEKAKQNPIEVIHMLLRDLGPKSAAEIKEELAELVIPENEWAKWWQSARAKIKKDTLIQSPEDLKDLFILRKDAISHEERFQKTLESNPEPKVLIQMVYNFLRDFPEVLKNETFKGKLQDKMKETLGYPDIKEPQLLQIHFLLEDMHVEKKSAAPQEIVKNTKSFEALIESIEILTFKKRVLSMARKNNPDWKNLFLSLLFTVHQNPIRDYLISELIESGTEQDLSKKLEDLVTYPGRYPDLFLWYFQKIMSTQGVPFSDKEGKNRFFEGFFVLLNNLENSSTQKDLIKKMHALLIDGRYAIVREIMQGASLETVKEFLLLATKCHSLGDHEIKILHSLAEVVHPSLGKSRHKQDATSEEDFIWTTETGFKKVKDRIQHIATVETVENAREIEVARSHGDLRENAEFKSALEKRSRLQSELKQLSDQVNHARVLTKEDISTSEVNIGTVVDCKNKEGKMLSYTLLGPWDADPDRSILSFQSKLAQTMRGLSVGDKFQFQSEEFTIIAIRSYL
jgi:transcription elongation factor GreA-like protein/transcription elongation GreA/GreB family factor